MRLQSSLNLITGRTPTKCGDFVERKALDTSARKVGDDDGAYQRLFEAFQNCQVATQARVIMVNPLHRKLPRVVLLLQTNSNRFTHNVLHQWLVLDTLCESILDPVLGPGIGHASAGDSRRRKLMRNQSVGVVDRYHPCPC